MQPSPVPGSAFASLHVRNFRLYAGGQFVSVTGQWMQIVALTLFVLDTTGSGTAVGLVALLQYGPLLFLSPWAGALLERSRKYRLLLLTQAGMGVLAAGLWVLAAMGGLSPGGVLLYSGLFGLLQAFDNPTRRVFVFAMVGPGLVANAVALNSAVMVCARLVGPAAGGLLIAAAGAPWCLFANAVSYVAIVGALLLMRRAELHEDRPSVDPDTRGPGAGLRYATGTPHVLWTLAMTGVVSLLLQNYPVIIPLIAAHGGFSGPEVVGLLFSALSVGSILASLVVAKLSRTGFRLVTRVTVAYGVIAVGAAIAPGIAGLMGALVLLGAVDQAFSSGSNATLQLVAAPAFRSRVLALYSALFLGVQGLSGLGTGALSDLIGPRTALLSAGVATVLIGAVAAWADRPA
ncbi:MAG: MFS transporter [Pseudonocardia sp.]|uniref:MFS transporter n=1 Tax=unclassified Pseudonocardia TaxID=2619320 RepID=UPI00086F08D9|nr:MULTISPECIES: MFS transporter [unclassified Pseudonocardia]MBN9108361.1 MFS transporter [Pseudonocardia sp.]ODU30340.1 MAG: hypothetical protein ABS80_00260 [Pseudonocardia sp. SCN 72-51]ODV08737.1 MAG: hypothetical protein ABT15_02705 [Pseudonocardia sp. SCN 73-27]